MHINKDNFKKIFKKNIIPIAVAVCVAVTGIVYFVTGLEKESDKSENGTFVDETIQETTFSIVQDMDKVYEEIYVYVCGCVNSPGVVCISSGSRIYEVIELAGGFSGDADINAVNQAEFVTDGQKVYIPAIGESVNSGENTGSSGLVNINTAGISELTTLPGIGESRAQAIIDYRDGNGPFSDIREIMNISGIKQSAFDKIKAYITV